MKGHQIKPGNDCPYDNFFANRPNNLSDEKPIRKGEDIEESKCVKYLGVKIENKLTLEEHIGYVQMKCKEYISILFQSKKYMQRELFLKINKQNVQPQYQYGVLIYGTTKKMIVFGFPKLQIK